MDKTMSSLKLLPNCYNFYIFVNLIQIIFWLLLSFLKLFGVHVFWSGGAVRRMVKWSWWEKIFVSFAHFFFSFWAICSRFVSHAHFLDVNSKCSCLVPAILTLANVFLTWVLYLSESPKAWSVGLVSRNTWTFSQCEVFKIFAYLTVSFCCLCT